jgi:hypothetical protein
VSKWSFGALALDADRSGFLRRGLGNRGIFEFGQAEPLIMFRER